MTEEWEVGWSTYTEESEYPSMCSVEVYGPRGVVTIVYARTRKELEKRAATVAAAPQLSAAVMKLLKYVGAADDICLTREQLLAWGFKL